MHLGICQAALLERSGTFVCKLRNSSNKSWHCPALGRLRHASAPLLESRAANASSCLHVTCHGLNKSKKH